MWLWPWLMVTGGVRLRWVTVCYWRLDSVFENCITYYILLLHPTFYQVIQTSNIPVLLILMSGWRKLSVLPNKNTTQWHKGNGQTGHCCLHPWPFWSSSLSWLCASNLYWHLLYVTRYLVIAISSWQTSLALSQLPTLETSALYASHLFWRPL